MRARFAAVVAGFTIALCSTTSVAATLKEPTPISVNPQRHPLQLLGVAVEAVKASKNDWKMDESYAMTEVPGGYRMRVTKEWNNRHVIYAYLTTTPQSVSITYPMLTVGSWTSSRGKMAKGKYIAPTTSSRSFSRTRSPRHSQKCVATTVSFKT